MRYEIKKHKGRSGKSVYEWRVYSVTRHGITRTIRQQLAKYRTEAEAQRCAEHFRAAIVKREKESAERAARYAAQPAT